MSLNKPSIALIRGKYSNRYELQNYSPLSTHVNTMVFSSLLPLDTPHDLPHIGLLSPADIPMIHRYVKYVCNRSIGDMHLLFGLEHQLEKFDILHTADPYYYYSYQAAQVKIKFPEKLLISSVWETIPFNNEATSVKQRLKRFVMNKTDVFLTYSKKAWKSLIQEEIPASKIHHLSLGIDTELFIPGSHSSKEILFVGRLVPEKDPFSVLQAFVQVLKTHPDYKLRLVGSGPEEKSLREFATKHKITEHVIFEKVSYENMPGIYQQADIFVLPSVTTKTWEEQYGMALLEGMSAGLPIVTTRSGAIGEIVGNAGLYVTEKSSTEIAHSLITLIEDQSLSQKLGTIGRDRAVKHFNREIFASKLLKLYETYFSRHTRKK